MNRASLLRRAYSIALILAVPCAYGAPVITQVSGTISQGATMTVGGSGFGATGAAPPVYYSTFDSYPLGVHAVKTGLDNLNGFLGSQSPYVDDTRAVSGLKSLRVDYPLNKGGAFPEVGLKGLNTTQIYVSAWIYWKRTAGAGIMSPVFKLVRAGADPVYHGSPRFYETIRPDASGAIIGVDRGSVSGASASGAHVTTYVDVNNEEPHSGAWYRIEYYYKLSTPGVANGVFQTWVDGVLNADLTNTMSRPAGNTATINNVVSPFDGMSNYGLNNSYSLWVDDFYVATTRARVELGDASTWSASKVRYIQPATTWSDGSISATVESNTFAPGTKAYVYVVAADGSVNSQGYPVTISGSSVPDTPVASGAR